MVRILIPATKFLRFICAAFLLGGIAALLLIIIVAFFPSGAGSARMRELPDSATDVKEHRWDAFGFHIYLMKARMPVSQYHTLAAKWELTTRFDEKLNEDLHQVVNMGLPDDAPVWWDPPKASQSTYFQRDEGRELLRVLHYGDGHAYYAVSAG